MSAKKQKLEEQSSSSAVISNIFVNISVFVNGYTGTAIDCILWNLTNASCVLNIFMQCCTCVTSGVLLSYSCFQNEKSLDRGPMFFNVNWAGNGGKLEESSSSLLQVLSVLQESHYSKPCTQKLKLVAVKPNVNGISCVISYHHTSNG